jgi:hypothetical protein
MGALAVEVLVAGVVQVVVVDTPAEEQETTVPELEHKEAEGGLLTQERTKITKQESMKATVR